MTSIPIKISYTLVFALIFGTVPMVFVAAEDSVVISNSVQSSTNTGGVSSSGQAGQDGEDGRDGTSGVSGSSGADGSPGSMGDSSQTSSGTASASITTTINGEVVESRVQTEQSDESAVVHASSSFKIPDDIDEVAQVTDESSNTDMYSTLLAIRSWIANYVASLF